MSTKFIIPVKLEDLCAYDSHRYVVETDFNQREVEKLLPDCAEHLRNFGPDFILKDFDVFYGVLKNFSTLDSKLLDSALRIIIKATDQLRENLRNVLNESVAEEDDDRTQQCNALKMILYVLCYMIELFEEKETKKSNAETDTAKAKSKKKKSDESHDWDRNKERCIDLLVQITELSLNRLFSPPVVEEELVNVINRCCYKLLENPSITKKDQLKSNVFHIIANSVSRHKQALNLCMKIIQLIQSKDTLVPILVQLVTSVVKDHKQKVIITELIREVERIDMTRDSNGTRGIAKLLEDVADKCSHEMIPSLSVLMQHLELDAYMMRSATLVILGKIVSNCLNSDDIDSKGRQLRDQLLDSLEDHILDVTTFTRSKALQVWTRLCEEGLIPLTRLESLIEAVVARLQDKSVYVRKNSVLFLTAFLNKNPFAAKIPLETLRSSFTKESKKLEQMLSENSKENEAEETENVESGPDDEEIWEGLQSELTEFWMEIASTSGSGEDDAIDIQNCTLLSECNEVEDVFARFKVLVLEKKFQNAFRLMKKIKDQWPKHKIFKASSEADSDEEDSGEESEISRETGSFMPDAVKTCKKIFFAIKTKEVMNLDNRAVAKNIEEVASGLLSQANQEEDVFHNDVNKQTVLVRYLKDCVKFAEQIQIAIPLVCSLLYSSSVTDVQEAIDFFVAAYQFGVQGALIGIRRMIVLIFSRDKVIKEAVLDAYRKVYLAATATGREGSYRSKDLAVVKSLIELVRGATLGEQISLEELLKNLFDSGDLGKEHTQILFEKYAKKLPDSSDAESVAAVQLIGMLACSNKEIIRGNIDTFITVGLAQGEEADTQLVQYTCFALQKAVDEKIKIEEFEKSYRFEHTHELFTRLQQIMVDSICAEDDVHWVPMCDEAIKVIYRLAEHPDWIAESLLRELVGAILPEIRDIEHSEATNEEGDTTTLPASQASAMSRLTQKVNEKELSSEILTRFLSVAGNVAFNQLIHMETSIAAEIKIRKLMKESKDSRKSKSSIASSKTPKRKSTMSSVGGENLEEEMGLAGAAAVEDVEADAIALMCNEEIVTRFGRRGENVNLLAALSDVVVKIASDPIKYPDIKLRGAATIALAKYMAMSEKFCVEHLRLLFTILKKSEEGPIRQNAIIALGDLCVRYPNHLDPFTPYLYSPLADKDVSVRMNTLKVLTRLILSDMVKVKGQISEVAKIIVDQEETLASYARFFFKELGKRENEIYNVLPDIISNLSGGQDAVEEAQFRTIMKFLFELIEKDRQTICLVEKLCQRFRATLEERQWRDLAYCLNLLVYSEKCIGKLYENMICFADKLCCEQVFEHIMAIIAGSRKIPHIKTETKEMLDEFEKKVKECRNKGVDGEVHDESELQEVVGTPTAPHRKSAAGRPGSAVKSRAKPKAVSSKAKAKKTRSRRKEDDDEEDEDEYDFEASEKPAPKEASSRPQRSRGAKRVLQVFSEESEDD
ncbi:Condensin complex subunit 1 [Halotydeus destructor]|nr:Condensin complex subunit 1 [Halotydeus destructor]